MNNLLLILGLLALSNGNTSLFGNKDKNVSNDSLKIDKKDNKKLVPKVKQNSKVVIKLENYPYMEYGYIEGYVSSISLVTQTQKTEKSTVETYLINVELPNGLTTNYEEVLDFKYELGGTADMIVKDRRLIERLFDNLRYRTK